MKIRTQQCEKHKIRLSYRGEVKNAQTSQPPDYVGILFINTYLQSQLHFLDVYRNGENARPRKCSLRHFLCITLSWRKIPLKAIKVNYVIMCCCWKESEIFSNYKSRFYSRVSQVFEILKLTRSTAIVCHWKASFTFHKHVTPSLVPALQSFLLERGVQKTFITC